MSGPLEAITRGLKSVCSELGSIIAYAVVFGSQVSGTARQDSDIDVGLRPRHDRAVELLRMLPDIAVSLAQRSGLPLQKIDLAVLDVEGGGRLPLLFRALARGVFACGDRSLYVSDLVRVASMYADHRMQLAKTSYLKRYAAKYAESCKGV